MKNHAVRSWPAFGGMSDTDPDDRIAEHELALNLNAVCDPTGRIVPWSSIYPVTPGSNLGVTATGVKAKVHCASRFRGKNAQGRAVAIVGSGMYRTGPNNIYQTWVPITFPTAYSTPALDRAAAFVFRNRYCYHQNGVDMPFRVLMENDDLSSPKTLAEIMGLRAPLSVCHSGSEAAGSRFPISRQTAYAVTFVYGDRGESGPSPLVTFQPSATAVSQTLTTIPVGPSGVTARRIYRSLIGAAPLRASTATKYIDWPVSSELFFLAEISDNAATSFTDSYDDAMLDFSRRCPPARPMPPVAAYQVVHQDRIAWANIKENPQVMFICSVEGNAALTASTVTVSNTGNGTITIKHNIGAGLVTFITVSNYKTKTLAAIRAEILVTYSNQVAAAGFASGSNWYARVAPGVDDTRTYRFAEIVDQNIYKNANVYSFEAIDDSTDAVVVDGQEKFPNRVMWSNLTFVEEINPLNTVDLSRHDVYPVTGLFRNDYTLGVCTQDAIWLLTGSLSADPETFMPDFSISRSQSEHGSFCTRPDAIAETPGGILFVAKDGLRVFQGQSSKRFYRQIKRRLMERIVNEPRARDNLSMCYEGGVLYIAYAGKEQA